MLTFEQFLRSAADEGRSVNGLWEERLFDVLGVTEKITVPLTARGIPHEIIGGLAVADPRRGQWRSGRGHDCRFRRVDPAL